MKDTDFLSALEEYARTELSQKALRARLNKSELFNDLLHWDIVDVIAGCKVEDGKLYSSTGELLSTHGESMDEAIPYFVNQETGYHEDNFYGDLFIAVDATTFVVVSYSA